MPRHELSPEEKALLKKIDAYSAATRLLLKELARVHRIRNDEAHATNDNAPVSFEQLSDGMSTAGLAEDHLRTGIMFLRKTVELTGEY